MLAMNNVFIIPAGNLAKKDSALTPDSELKNVPIAVGPLKLSHLKKSVNTWNDAFLDDPMQRYLSDGAKGTPISVSIKKLCMSIVVTLSLTSKITLTVNAGAAILYGSLPKNGWSHKQKISELVLLAVYKVVWRAAGTSAERDKRMKELSAKTEEAMKIHLGERQKDMMCLELLATHPSSQGKGYGGALVEAFNALADNDGFSTWLLSSNINNTEFYNSHGFETVADIVLGDTNPAWHEPPIIVKLMVREYKSPGEKSEV